MTLWVTKELEPGKEQRNST